MDLLRTTINAGHCLLNLEAHSIEEVITAAVDSLVEKGGLPEDLRERAVSGLLSREQDVPTVIGRAFAVPHLYDDAITEPAAVFVRLTHPVNMGAPDGIATRFVFVMLGPKSRAEEHLDSLAHLARLMSDDEFHFDASNAVTVPRLRDAVDGHARRMQQRRVAAKEKAEPKSLPTGLFAGLKSDVSRRLPAYVRHIKDGLKPKSAASILFLFFACLAPAVTFGGIMGQATDGQIGAMEMLVASAVCGMVYSLCSGQPLIILGGIGPLLIFTVILYRLCGDMQMQDQFLGVYGWVGLWTAVFTVLCAVTNASNLMRFFTRFTDEIFSVLMSLIFIYEAVKAVVKIFQSSFADPAASHDSAFLAMILAVGTYMIAITLSRFRRSSYLFPWMREFLADFGPSIALCAMAVVAFLLRNEVAVPGLSVSASFETTSGRPWLVDLNSVPWSVRLMAAGPALLATVLVFLSQNITARLVNSPQNKLADSESFHLDLLVVGILIGGCSFFGFPWLVAAAVRSLAHVRALADTEEVVSPGGGPTRDRIIHVNENRVTAFAIHALMAGSLFAVQYLKLVPMSALYGIFLYMGIVSLQGTQFMERMSLWLMDRDMYPTTHYIRQLSRRRIHFFTFVQALCLVVLCVVNVWPSETVRILFPVFIALLIPVRWLVGKIFTSDELEILDADEEPETEELHWV